MPALATYHDQWFAAGTGDAVVSTDDIYTMLGWVVLASADKAAVEADYRRLKDLELALDISPVSVRNNARSASA